MSTSKGRADVLIVTNMWPYGGNPAYGIFVKRQVDSLVALGLDCHVIFVEGYRTRWAYALEALRMLLLNFSPRRPAVVHGHGGETAPVVRCFVRGPAIVSFCGDDLLGTPTEHGGLTPWSRVRRRLLRTQARLMSATITKSAQMEATLPEAIRRRNRVIPNGVDRDMFRPRPRAEARRMLEWPDEERVALFAADPAVTRKRFWLAESACRAAEREIGPVRLWVTWGTPPAEMPLLMSAADCLLLTSAIEGSPNVVKEAVACDLPVVSTDVGDVREVLSQVEPSWVCSDAPHALAAALIQCLSEPRRSNGREQAAWLDQRLIAQRVAAVYQALAPSMAFTAAPDELPG